MNDGEEKCQDDNQVKYVENSQSTLAMRIQDSRREVPQEGNETDSNVHSKESFSSIGKFRDE